MADLSIQKAFLEGMQEIYSTMFTSQIYFQYLDEEMTFKNVYKESTDKKYKAPIQLTGRVELSVKHEDAPEMGTILDAVITIPSKEFMDNNMPITPQDFNTLKKGIIVFDNVTYIIEEVKPTTLIAEKFMFYVFECRQAYKASISELM